jgi:hypothetical protein
MADATKTQSTLPSPIADGLDSMYHQLAEIHVIVAAQLVECACWRRLDPTSSPIQAGISR